MDRRADEMNTPELIKKVNISMSRQCEERGYAAPVDVLIDIGALSKKNYEDWRYGRVDYLERVCTMNLHKLSSVLFQMKTYAKKAGLKPSFCYYKRWGVTKKTGQGHKPVIPLRFSKSGDENIERAYATHFVNSYRIQQIKDSKQKSTEMELP